MEVMEVRLRRSGYGGYGDQVMEVRLESKVGSRLGLGFWVRRRGGSGPSKTEMVEGSGGQDWVPLVVSVSLDNARV